jgi:hypothetical protein
MSRALGRLHAALCSAMGRARRRLAGGFAHERAARGLGRGALVLVLGAGGSSFVAGCSNGARVELVLHVPAGDSPLRSADAVALTVLDSGGNTVAFSRGPASAASLSAGPLPAGSGFVAELTASFGSDVVARGRSCAFTVGATAPRVPMWFSRVGHFASTGSPRVARPGALALPWSGGALWAGGAGPAGSDGALATTEVYDPATAQFGDGPALATGRADAMGALLADGGALIAGGAAAGVAGLEALREAHSTPEPSPFSPTLTGGAMVLLGDGSVLLAGGRLPGAAPLATAWRISNGGASVDPLPAMASPRVGLTLTRLGSDRSAAVLIAGGEGGSGPLATLELFDPFFGGFSTLPMALVTARSGASATLLPSGVVLVIGGIDAAGGPLASAEIIDVTGRGVRAAGALGSARTRHSATLLPSGRVLVAGGIDATGNPTASAEIFDPALGDEGGFVPTAPLATPRADHTLVPLCDGTFLVVGGAASAEIYNPL